MDGSRTASAVAEEPNAGGTVSTGLCTAECRGWPVCLGLRLSAGCLFHCLLHQGVFISRGVSVRCKHSPGVSVNSQCLPDTLADVLEDQLGSPSWPLLDVLEEQPGSPSHTLLDVLEEQLGSPSWPLAEILKEQVGSPSWPLAEVLEEQLGGLPVGHLQRSLRNSWGISQLAFFHLPIVCREVLASIEGSTLSSEPPRSSSQAFDLTTR